MASSYSIICSHCSFRAGGWDEGKPYNLDEKGKKVYGYHPSSEPYSCLYSIHRYTCLSCARRIRNDTREATLNCPRCDSEDLCPDAQLFGKPCPKCKKGTLGRDPDAMQCIS
ncbi:MAG: hypothetical protein QM477_03670 [Planctomycetota bacterium]